MLLAYVDESYRNINEKFLMAAVVVNDQQANALTAELDDVVAAVTLNRGVSHHIELHAQDIWHGTNEWSFLHDDHAGQINLMTKCMDAIARHASHLIWRAIDVAAHRRIGYPSTWPPAVVGFQHLLERVERFSSRREELALVICDEVDDPNAPRRMLRFYREAGTPGYIATPLPSIIDTVHFAPSDHSRLLQAADILAYIACQYMHRDQLHALVRPVVDDLYGRIRASGKSWYNGVWPRAD